MFSVMGRHYIIIGKDCMISERDNIEKLCLFKDVRQLIQGYTIDEQPLEQRLKEIEILYVRDDLIC